MRQFEYPNRVRRVIGIFLLSYRKRNRSGYGCSLEDVRNLMIGLDDSNIAQDRSGMGEHVLIEFHLLGARIFDRQGLAVSPLTGIDCRALEGE